MANNLLRNLPPLSLYIHVPWCVKKCPYCDFNSHELHGVLDESAYINALLSDLYSDANRIEQRSICSIFIGGGTPSLLSADAIKRLLDGVRAQVNLSPNAEITLEANPGVAEQARFYAFRDAGVNRLSLGIQSFSDMQLAALGRIHNAEQARRAIDMALAVFTEVNLDIMYALPNQTLNAALSDIDTAISSGAQHLSAYQLTLEANTMFAVRPPKNLPDEDLAADMQSALESHLAAAGFEHYETSAFARAGHRCQHNLNYWQFGDYLGIGAGAHSKISFAEHIERAMRYKQPNAYLSSVAQGDARQIQHAILHQDLAFEFMMNALRLVDGFSTKLFSERTGLSLDKVSAVLDQAQQQGLLEYNSAWIQPTGRGQLFLNDLLALFLD